MKSALCISYVIFSFFTFFLCAEEEHLPEESETVKTPIVRCYFGGDFLSLQTNIQNWGQEISGKNTLKGIRWGYDAIKPNAFYIGAHALTVINNAEFYFRAQDDDLVKPKRYQSGDLAFFNLEARTGYTFGGQEKRSALFLGLGWYDMIFPYKVDQYLSEFLFYLTGGTKISYSFGPFFSMGLNAKVLWAFAMLQRFHYRSKARSLTKKPIVIEDVHYTRILCGRGTAWGTEIGIPLTWHIKRMTIELEPYYLRLGSPKTEISYEKGALKGYGARFLLGFQF